MLAWTFGTGHVETNQHITGPTMRWIYARFVH